MVIDTSAVLAILRKEPEQERMLHAIAGSPVRLLSAITMLEASLVIEGRYGTDAGADLDLFIYDAGFETVPFDARQAQIALRAWRRYGKGNHPARLNMGDCCVYALAKTSGEPVLCKGADFPQTDIPIVPLC